jgi:membrane protease YdiL (CAAX protease family)
MLIVGLLFYVPIAIIVTRERGRMRSARLASLGLLPSSKTGAPWSLALIAVAVVTCGPTAILIAIRDSFRVSPLGILANLQPPILEEFLVRGIVWAVLLRNFSGGVALAWSTLLFWTWHWEFGISASIMTAGWATLACALPRLASGLIWPAVIFHLMCAASIGQSLVLPEAITSALFIWRDRRKRKAAQQGIEADERHLG